jgi:GNAT superfamily N-acetyltransferase
MIKELAHFENADDAVEATEESLLNTLCLASSGSGDLSSGAFPTQATGYAKTLILTAQPENEVAGMALYFHNYSTWTSKPGIYLEDLYVRTKFRRRGYASLLLKELAKEVVKIK